MNYPKMLYKSESVYTDNEQLRNDLYSKALKTIIVSDFNQETMRRGQGYVDLEDLMYDPSKVSVDTVDTNGISETFASSPDVEPMALKPKRKYVRKVKTENVGHDAA